MGGAGSFVMVAENFNSFGQAILSKLIAEIAINAPEPIPNADAGTAITPFGPPMHCSASP